MYNPKLDNYISENKRLQERVKLLEKKLIEGQSMIIKAKLLMEGYKKRNEEE
jgi:hypothetical protein